MRIPKSKPLVVTMPKEHNYRIEEGPYASRVHRVRRMQRQNCHNCGDLLRIDFALEVERTGKSAEESIYEAALVRFRPIMMTTAAAMLGALPLALGRGVGSEIRRPLGIAIVGGLIVSQMLTLYTTPVVYLYMDAFKDWVLEHLPWRTQSAKQQDVPVFAD